MENQEHVIELVIGDWSGDGHEKTRRILLRTNLSSDEIINAYAEGTKVIGVDVMNEVAAEYEDSWLREDSWNKFVAAGIAEMGWEVEGGPEHHWETGEAGLDLDTDSFLDLFLFTVLRGNPSFKYEEIQPSASLPVGGYGLFH